MPEKVAMFLCLGVSWFVDIEAQAARPRVSGIVITHDLGDRSTLAFAQIMDCAPVDDAGEFAADHIIVVGVAIVVRPAPCNRIDVLEDIIFRGLWVGSCLLDLLSDPADSVARYCQVEPSRAVGVASPFQGVAQEGNLVAPMGDAGFLLIESQAESGPHPVGELCLDSFG